MAKYIKNADNIARVWCGMEIQPGAYYLLQYVEEHKFAHNSDVMSSITNETLIVSKNNDSSGHITDYATAISYLNDNILDIDDQGRQISRLAAGQAGWTYIAHPIEFETSKVGGLYEKLSDDTNRSASSVKFYDINNVEITDAQYEPNIVKTVILFKPNYDYEILSGNLQQIHSPTTDIRLWVLGGIIELGGPYVKEFAGGLNMRFYGANESVKTDGRAAKYMKKDIVGVPYQANQLQIIVKHNAGVQHKLMLTLEYFKA